MNVPIDLSFDCGVDISAAAQSLVPSFEMVAYSGGVMYPAGIPGAVVVDISGMEGIGESRPALKNHDADQIVGNVAAASAQVPLLVRGVFLSTRYASEVISAHREGFRWKASISGKVLEAVEVPEGETIAANGQTFTGPLTYVKRFALREYSFVPAAGDDETSVSIAAKDGGGSDMSTDTKPSKDTDTKVVDSKKTDEPNVERKLAAGHDGSSLNIDPKFDFDEHVRKLRESTTAELKRQQEITELFAGAFPDIQAKAIGEGWDVTKAELELLRKQRDNGPSKQSDSAGAKLSAKLSECALLFSSGAKHVTDDFLQAQFGQETLEESQKMRGYGLHALYYDTIRAAGRHVRPGQVNNDFLREALTADRELRASGEGFTTLSLTNVLEQSAGKVLLSAYQSIETIWNFVAAVRSHRDFKAYNVYRLDANGTIKKVGKDGELKQMGLADAKYTNQLDTYGATISLTRQDQINDDMNAFLQIPTILGEQTAIRLEEAVFGLILSNPSSFFSAGNKNLLTGAASALDATSLGDAREKFRNQTSNNKPILHSPRILLVNTLLEDIANDLWMETEMAVTTTTDKKRFKRNPHKGLYRPYITPYLNNTDIKDQDGAAISGQSDTQWYLFADPGVRAAVAVAFLNGQRTPTIESADTNFTTLGVQWRVYHDWGVAMEDPKAAVKSNGV